MKRELQGLEEEHATDKHLESFRKVFKWKTPGHDGVHGFRLERFTSMHERLVLQVSKWQEEARISEKMTKKKNLPKS